MKDRKAFAFLVIASLIWGTSFPAIEFGLKSGLNYYLILLLRYLIGAFGSLFIVAILKRGRLFLSLFKNRRLVLLGVLNLIATICGTYGQIFTASGKAALLLNINFIYVAILSVLIFKGKERLDKFKMVSIVLGIFGAYFLTIGFDFQQLFMGTLLGDIMILLSGFIWALFIVLSKELLDNKEPSKNIDPIDLNNSVICTTVLFGLIPFLFLIFIDPSVYVLPGDLISWLVMVNLGLICTPIAYILYNKGLAKMSPIVVSIISLLEVLTATTLGIIFLPNILYFSLDFAIGASLIICAIIISNAK
jgi:drug/metabolite transporter (DMT)-like permease